MKPSGAPSDISVTIDRGERSGGKKSGGRDSSGNGFEDVWKCIFGWHVVVEVVHERIKVVAQSTRGCSFM